jgi:hypothetical protein
VGPTGSVDDVEKRKYLTLPGLELRPLGRPASSQSLYRLSCLDSHGCAVPKKTFEDMLSSDSDIVASLLSKYKILISAYGGNQKRYIEHLFHHMRFSPRKFVFSKYNVS